MKVANFGPLQALGTLRTEDYINYLKMISARNRRVKEPQFHAAISAKGKSHDKHALTTIAVEWLGRMGYAEQPYLIIFHKDTAHNHVHVVSNRIDRNGKKISSAFEHNRAIQNLNKVLGLDEQFSASQDLNKALAYQFGTKAQFMMILENMGYKIKELDGALSLIKFGKQHGGVDLRIVLEKAKQYHPLAERRVQLKALFHKYSLLHNTSLYEQEISLPCGLDKSSGTYTSELANYLKEKMGVHLVFHSKEGKLPYGYTVLDHSVKIVWKGSEIMRLAELLAVKVVGGVVNKSTDVMKIVPASQLNGEVKDYYQTLLKAAQHNYPDLKQGLNEQELSLSETQNGLILSDVPMQISIPADALLAPEELQDLRETYQQLVVHSAYIPPISIADDVDDQQIHGMRRRRQKKTRTNTR